jgi:hypothetical protein
MAIAVLGKNCGIAMAMEGSFFRHCFDESMSSRVHEFNLQQALSGNPDI